MKALVYDGFGDPSVIKMKEVAAPRLGAHQIRIRVRASGLNRADLVQRRGLYPPPPGESEIPGMEVSGEVDEVSSDVTQFRKGDRVMALIAGGGYAEQVCVDAGLVLPLPDRYSFVEGAATMEVFLTAHHNVFYLGGARKADAVLIHAGASGVGTAAIQMQREAGMRTYVTVGSAEKKAACEKLGAVGIDYKKENFAQVLAAKEAKGINVILDPVGAGYLESNLKVLGLNGRMVLIGLMSGSETKLDMRSVLNKRLRIIGSTLRGLPLVEKIAIVARFKSEFYETLAAGKIHPIVDTTFPAESAGAAQTRMEANLNIGKIVLDWGIGA